MFRSFALSLLIAASSLAAPAAAVWAEPIVIPTVPVGNPGNAGELSGEGAGGYGPNVLAGAVPYAYRIGQFEVTNAQYAEFLNAKAQSDPLALYNENMQSSAMGGIIRSGSSGSYTYAVKPDRGNRPVIYVSWYDAVRFANWLHNGQGSGNTETGAYTLLGGTPTPSNGLSITRNAKATWWLPSEDEWYKAAYHKNDGATGNYWKAPLSSDAMPDSDQPPGNDAPSQANTANCFRDDGIGNAYNDGFAVSGSADLSDDLDYLTDVGAYAAAASPYGTFDQGGNVWEWNETVIFERGGAYRGMRGGSWVNLSSNLLAPQRRFDGPLREDDGLGFRVATIPEPGTAMLGMMGSVLTLCWLKKRR